MPENIFVPVIKLYQQQGAVTNANTGLAVVEPLVRKYRNVTVGLCFLGQLAVPVSTGKEKQSGLKNQPVGFDCIKGF